MNTIWIWTSSLKLHRAPLSFWITVAVIAGLFGMLDEDCALLFFQKAEEAKLQHLIQYLYFTSPQLQPCRSAS